MAKKRAAAITVERVRKVSTLITKAFSIADTWFPKPDQDRAIWYRGVKDINKHKLIPSAFRTKHTDEEALWNDYRLLAPAHLDREPVDDWEWYFLMQHYGLPTRLLDWTESLLVACYFAYDGWNGKTTPCIWMLDAGELNQLCHKFDFPVITGGKFSGRWLPDKIWRKRKTFMDAGKKYSTDRPFALYPRRRWPRMVGQQAVFTVHGRSDIPLEDLYVAANNPKKYHIARIELSMGDQKKVLSDLRVLGVIKSTLFPELSSIADDIRTAYHV